MYVNINVISLRLFLLTGLESESESHSVLSDSLQPYGLYSPWNSPSQNTGVSCRALLQGIFLTQGLNPHLLCLLHWQGCSAISATSATWKAHLCTLRDHIFENMTIEQYFKSYNTISNIWLP